MLRRLLEWLFGAPKEMVTTEQREKTTPYVIPSEASEDEVMQRILSECWNSGSAIVGVRHDDGSVLVSEMNGPDDTVYCAVCGETGLDLSEEGRCADCDADANAV